MRRAAALLLTLAACGPVSVEQAERNCISRAKSTASPIREAGIGIGSNGRAGGFVDIEITSDYLRGRDPSAVYDACVYQQSGQPPRQPLYTRPDWRG